MMHAQSFFIGGMPMLFYGDELAYTNDYSYLEDPGKSYDNRWMHRPVMNREKIRQAEMYGTPEERIFSATRKLLKLRKKFSVFADQKNLVWLSPHNIHVCAFIRTGHEKTIYCLFNYSAKEAFVTWFIFRENGPVPKKLVDHWNETVYTVGADYEYLIIQPFSFCILESI
jgi:amylosucrase